MAVVSSERSRVFDVSATAPDLEGLEPTNRLRWRRKKMARFPIRSCDLLLALGVGICQIAYAAQIALAANAEDPFLALIRTAMNKMMAV